MRYFNGSPVFAFFFDEEDFFEDRLAPRKEDLEFVMSSVADQ